MILQPSAAQDNDFSFYSDLARNWYQGGDYFEWTSTTEDNNSEKVNVFYRTWGEESNPKLVLIHGFPNSSFDYYKLIPFLEDDYHIATLDFPGSGFSDKPLDGYNYMLEENAEIVDYFVREVVGFEDFALYTHDRGVSIGLAFLGNYLADPDPGYTVNYHFLSNSGMFLPLANLSAGQMRMLDVDTAEQMLATRAARPRLTEGEPESLAYSDIFAFKQGNLSLIYVGRYLLERQANEVRWLENLTTSPVPVVYLWGLADNVNPVRIANYVWDTYLDDRNAQSSYWILPTAGHYPQRDNPEEVGKVIRMALRGEIPDREGEGEFMRRYGASRSAQDAVFVGHSSIEALNFPNSIRYTPSGYRVAQQGESGPRILSVYHGLDPLPPRATRLCNRPPAAGQDGMPVTFSVQINEESVFATAFSVELSSGERVTPLCATLRPALEPLEQRTVLLIGSFSPDDSLPVSVEIVDELEDANGNSLVGLRGEDVTALESGPSLVFAERFAPELPELEGECPEATSQAIQLTWEGGVTGPQGAALAEAQRLAVSVVLENGDTVQPLALGDDDPDNHVILCIGESSPALEVSVAAGFFHDPGDDANPATRVSVN